LDSVSIEWKINGKSVSSGIGKKIFYLNAPAAGGETTVVITVFSPSGKIEKTVTIKPVIMTLLWQANDSYVPPFYRGKALPSSSSQIKVVAVPEIKSGSVLVSPTTMVYAWKKDYTNNVDGSGYGKNYFIYTSDYLDDSNNIGVKASTVDQKYSLDASIDVGTVQPKILFYKNDPVLGTQWEQSLSGGHRVIGNEIIEGDPYFISPKNIKTPLLAWDWYINDNKIDVAGVEKNLFPIMAQEGTSGTSTIRLEVKNIYKVFESASKEINVTF
jgi:hypothetical protein